MQGNNPFRYPPPESPAQFKARYPEQKAFIDEVIKMHSDHERYMNHSVCRICDQPLTHADMQLHSPMHFNICCAEHIQYATLYDIRSTRKQLGYAEYREW